MSYILKCFIYNALGNSSASSVFTVLPKYVTLFSVSVYEICFEVQHTHTHNRFTALLEYVWDHPGEQVPER